MAESAMTTTGLAEFQAATDAFPLEIQRALQAVAETHGRRVQVKAQQALRPALRTAIVITMVSDPAKHEVRVEAKPAQNYPTSITLWFEYGTAGRSTKHPQRYVGRIEALHYMQQAVSGEESAYRSALNAAAVSAAQGVFKG